MAEQMIYNLVKDSELKYAQQFHFSKNFTLLAWQLLYKKPQDAVRLPFPSCFCQLPFDALCDVLVELEKHPTEEMEELKNRLRLSSVDFGIWVKRDEATAKDPRDVEYAIYLPTGAPLTRREDKREDEAYVMALGMLATFALQLLGMKSQFITQKIVLGSAKKSASSKFKKNQPRIRHTYVDVKMTDEQIVSLSDDPRRRSSPGLHLVRGHFKLLKTGKLTWWRPFVRGKKEYGVIAHDYRVQAEEKGSGRLGRVHAGV